MSRQSGVTSRITPGRSVVRTYVMRDKRKSPLWTIGGLNARVCHTRFLFFSVFFVVKEACVDRRSKSSMVCCALESLSVGGAPLLASWWTAAALRRAVAADSPPEAQVRNAFFAFHH